MSLLPERVEYSKTAMRWLTEDYPERLQDMENWFVCQRFWKKWEGNPEIIQKTWDNLAVQTRAIIEAKLQALDDVLNLQEKTEQLIMSMFTDANDENWYLYEPNEAFDNYVQWLHSRLEKYLASYQAKRSQGLKVEIPGNVYEIKDTIQVVHLLAELGIPKEKIVSMRHGLTKSKYASGELKRIALSDLPQNEKQGKILEVLEQVADPNLSVDTFLDNKKRRGFEASKGDLPIDGSVVILPQGELIQIRSPKTSTTKAIQYQLKGLVDGWNQVDAVELATQLTDEVYTKGKYRPTRLFGDRLVQGNEGVMMPTQSRFVELCWIQLGRTSRYLSEIMSLTPDGSAQMTIFEIGIKCRTKEELEKHLKEQFRTNVQGITMSLETAIKDFYEIPEGIEALFDSHQTTTTLEVWWRQGSALEVRLTCIRSNGSEILNVYEDSGEREMQYSGQE